MSRAPKHFTLAMAQRRAAFIGNRSLIATFYSYFEVIVIAHVTCILVCRMRCSVSVFVIIVDMCTCVLHEKVA